MHITKNTLGMLVRRYTAVLHKCHMLNILGGAVVAGALLLGAGGASLVLPTVVQAEEISITSQNEFNAAASGGRISDPTATVTFSGTETFTIAGETTTANGGVVSAETVNFKNPQNTFMNNSAGNGGGVVGVSQYGSVTISGGTFTDNKADVKGGVVYADKGGVVTISGGTFYNNYAGSDSSSASFGGVVFVENNGSVTISGGTFTGNHTVKAGADQGGVVFARGSVFISGGTFADNSASFGGAVSATDDITLKPGEGESVSFETASDSLYTSGGTKTITINGAGTVNLYSENNYAGGGVIMKSGTLNLGKAGVTNGAVFKSPDSSSNPATFTMTGGVTNVYTANAFGDSAGDSATIKGGTLVLKATQDANTIILNSGGTINADAADVLPNFTQTAGTINANVANALTGTTVNGGTLNANAANALTDTTVNGGTCNANAADAFSGSTAVNTGGTLNFTEQASGVVSGTFTGDGAITSSGNISVDQSDTFGGFTGDFTVNGGTTTVNAVNAFGGALIHNGGVLALNAAQKLSAAYTLNAGQTLAFAANSVAGSTTPVLDANGNTVTLKSGSFVTAKVGGELAKATQGAEADYVVIGNAAADSTYNATLQTESTEPGVDNSLFTIERLGADAQQYTVRITREATQTVLPDVSTPTADLIDANIQEYGLDTDSPIAAVRFFSRVTSTTEGLGNDPRLAAATVEGALQLAAAGAVPAMTLSAAEAGVDALHTRLSATPAAATHENAAALHMDAEGNVSESGLSAGDGLKNGFGLWLMPLYQNNSVWGMSAGAFDTGYNSSLGGLALGADYTVADAFRFGLALHLGEGYATSNGDFNQTDNNFNFWGVSLYGAYTWNALTLAADAGYTSNFSSVTQELPAVLHMGDLESDVTSHVWQAGLRAEYKLATPYVDITPHAGVRFMGLTTDGYDITNNGATVFEVEEDYQSIWTFPVGVTLGKEFTTQGGWTFTPQVDAGILFAAGDVKAKSRISVPGVNATEENTMQVADYTTFSGGLGVTVSNNDNLSFGLNYNLQASEHRTGHGLNSTVRYEF